MSARNSERNRPDGEVFAYALSDPRNHQIRYIGQTACGLSRARSHYSSSSLKKKRNTHKDNWIKQLKSLGIKYQIDILEYCDSLDALDQAEIFWISYWKFIGADLTNLTEGGGVGERPKNRKSLEARIKISKSKGGRPIQDDLGNRYETIADAKRKIGTDGSAIQLVLQGKQKQTKGRTFSYIGEPLPEPYRSKGSRGELTANHKIKIARGKGYSPIVDQNGKIYQTISEAADFLGCKASTIANVLNPKRYEQTIYGFSFSFVKEKTIKQIKDQNGEIYNSIADAAARTGLSTTTVRNVLTGKSTSTKGYTFTYLNDNLIPDIGEGS